MQVEVLEISASSLEAQLIQGLVDVNRILTMEWLRWYGFLLTHGATTFCATMHLDPHHMSATSIHTSQFHQGRIKFMPGGNRMRTLADIGIPSLQQGKELTGKTSPKKDAKGSAMMQVQ